MKQVQFRTPEEKIMDLCDAIREVEPYFKNMSNETIIVSALDTFLNITRNNKE